MASVAGVDEAGLTNSEPALPRLSSSSECAYCISFPSLSDPPDLPDPAVRRRDWAHRVLPELEVVIAPPAYRLSIR
jgi:hypothetical protein